MVPQMRFFLDSSLKVVRTGDSLELWKTSKTDWGCVDWTMPPGATASGGFRFTRKSKRVNIFYCSISNIIKTKQNIFAFNKILELCSQSFWTVFKYSKAAFPKLLF